jgi:glycosyltransferase involved in cell wall biosynthesis
VKLSIIIPVYNVDLYLIECLESVFNQDISECEIIAINDGSTDGSGNILDEYQQRYPDFIVIHQTNKGLSGARNTGIEKAHGDYIYFLDSDDYLLPDSIQLILYKIKENSCEIIGFNALIDNTKFFTCNILSESPMIGTNFFEDFYLKNTFYPIVNVWLYVYKLDFIRSNNLIFLEGFYHEDIHFSSICFCLTRSIIVFDIPILRYRLYREGSISATVCLKNLKDKSFINRYLNIFYITRNFNNPFFYNHLFHSYVFTIMQAVDNNHTMNRKEYFSLRDVNVMKKGILSEFEFKLWMLAIVNNKLMINYYRNSLPNYLRHVINIVLAYIYKCLMKIVVNKKLNKSVYIPR